MKSIYIVLTDTGTRFTRMIKFVTRAPYNHASIALDPELNEVYSFGRKSMRCFLKAGFVREHPDAGIYAVQKSTTCVVYELKIDDERHARIVEEIARFEKQADRYKYNLLGFVNFALRRPLPRRSAFFCSEFVAHVLDRAGLNLPGKPPGLTAPHDFMKCPELKKIYEGPLAAFRRSAPLPGVAAFRGAAAAR